MRAASAGLLVCAAGTLAVQPAVASGLIAVLAWVAGRVVRDHGLREQELRAVERELERAGDGGRRSPAARSACGWLASCTTRWRTA